MGTRPTTIIAGLLLTASLGACNDAIVDDFGPSGGWTLVEGQVRDAAGTGLSGVEVLLTSCEPPIGGLAGEDMTGEDGSYSILGSLPPVGALPPDFSLEDTVSCVVVAGRGLAQTPLETQFFRELDEVIPHRVDLVTTTSSN